MAAAKVKISGSWIPLPALHAGQGLSSDSHRKVGSPCQSSAEIEDGESDTTSFIFRAEGGWQENLSLPR